MLILEIAAGVFLGGLLLVRPFYPKVPPRAREQERAERLQWRLRETEAREWLARRKAAQPTVYYPTSWLFSRKIRAR
jgi:hypothetical protein